VTTVYLGLGSNLGDRAGYLVRACERLRELDPLLQVSPVYETAPVGGPSAQGSYLNCVVRLEWTRTPRELLALAQEIESAAERVREVRWGPRTLDVDLLIIDGVTIDEPDLVVPHPRIGERAFVLAPLEDLNPGIVPARWREELGGDEQVARSVRRVELTL